MRSADLRPAAWDYDPARRPARSLLAGIAPVGIGTPLAEDLASYFARLSCEHTRAPSRLVRDVLAPSLGDGAGPESDAKAWEEELARVTRHATGSLVGHAPVAATWADALAAATGHPDLRVLTLLSWADVLPRKGLLRAERAWCAACLELWSLRGLTVYAPLLWQVAPVTSCVEHQVRLTTACPACGETAGLLMAWTRVGYCRCGEWLGRLWVHEDEFVDEDELDWQRYVTAQVGALIAATPRLPEVPSGALTADAVRLCWERTGLSLTRLAEAIGMSLSTVSMWKDGRRQPWLPGALRLCRVAGVELVDFLRGDFEALLLASSPVGVPSVPHSKEVHRRIDWDTVGRELRAAVEAPTPVSLASVLRLVDLDTRQAKRVYPEECLAIASRYEAWRREGAAARREHDAQLVHETIAQFLAVGIKPSRHQVQKQLPKSVSLRRPALYAIWVEKARDPERRFLKV